MSENPPEAFRYAVSRTIQSYAMTFPQTVEGTSCVNRTFKAGGKNFVFLGEKDDECHIRLKLRESIPEIRELASTDPDRWQIGDNGWALLRFSPTDPPNQANVEQWIAESFRLLAPKKIVKLLSE